MRKKIFIISLLFSSTYLLINAMPNKSNETDKYSHTINSSFMISHLNIF